MTTKNTQGYCRFKVPAEHFDALLEAFEIAEEPGQLINYAKPDGGIMPEDEALSVAESIVLSALTEHPDLEELDHRQGLDWAFEWYVSKPLEGGDTVWVTIEDHPHKGLNTDHACAMIFGILHALELSQAAILETVYVGDRETDTQAPRLNAETVSITQGGMTHHNNGVFAEAEISAAEKHEVYNLVTIQESCDFARFSSQFLLVTKKGQDVDEVMFNHLLNLRGEGLGTYNEASAQIEFGNHLAVSTDYSVQPLSPLEMATMAPYTPVVKTRLLERLDHT
jgi:hypothetical protein